MKLTERISNFWNGKPREAVTPQPELIQKSGQLFHAIITDDIYEGVILPFAVRYKTSPEQAMKRIFRGGLTIAEYGDGKYKLPDEDFYRELSDHFPLDDIPAKIISADFTPAPADN